MKRAAWTNTVALLLGDVLFGFVPILQKFTYPYGGSGPLTVFYMSLLALPMLAALANVQRISLSVSRQDRKKLLFLSLGGSCTALLLYASYRFIPVGLATTIHFIYPVLIAVGLALFFHQRFTPRHIFVLILALSGIVCLGTAGQGSAQWPGILLALLSGFTWAFYIIYMEKSGLNQFPTCVVNFYLSLVSVLIAGPVCLLSHQFRFYSHALPWAILLAAAFLHRILGCSLFQIGMRKTSAFTAGILSTAEPLSALLFGTIFLNEQISSLQTVGLGLILCSILANLRSRHPRC